MSKNENQRLKLLYLQKILLEQTDEHHPLTVPQLIDALAKEGIAAERKSIYSDLTLLSQFGLDLLSRSGKISGWYVASREFELPELKLLVDAVQSSRFLTEKKSHALIKKLEGLGNRHDGKQLNRQVFVGGRAKTMNERIYYNVDEIHSAIATHRTIGFRYFDYNLQKNKVFRREGRRYIVCPFGLIYNDGNYYLVAYDTEKKSMRHYRVDKMAELGTMGYPFEGESAYPNFNLASYAQQHFGMFSGDPCNVTLRCKNAMAGIIIDRFGRDIMLIPQDDDHFTATLPVVLSTQFFGWLFGLGAGVEIVAPEIALRRYRGQLQEVSELYEK